MNSPHASSVSASPKNSAHEKLNCMEVHGGYQPTNSFYKTAGLRIWLYSQPHQQSQAGGDVYYLSACASGRITRILLADISGHGEALQPVSQKLQQLMRKNINRISPRRLISQLNQEFEADPENHLFATGLVATYFCPSKTLTLNVAGHPRPVVLREGQTEWRRFSEAEFANSAPITNLPLGVHQATEYDSHRYAMELNDLCLFYTDGLIEITTHTGEQLGTDGLIKLLNRITATTQTDAPEDLIPQLLTALRENTTESLEKDDVTLILCQIQPAHITLQDNLMAPVRLVRSLLQGHHTQH